MKYLCTLVIINNLAALSSIFQDKYIPFVLHGSCNVFGPFYSNLSFICNNIISFENIKSLRKLVLYGKIFKKVSLIKVLKRQLSFQR
jgi:hypothetical protein